MSAGCRSGSALPKPPPWRSSSTTFGFRVPGIYQFAAALLTAADGQLREVHITDLTDSTFYAQALLANGAIVDGRPSDALTLALVTGAPIYVAPGVLEQTANQEDALRALLDEVEHAPDDARAIADDVRTRIAASAAELAELRQRRPAALNDRRSTGPAAQTLTTTPPAVRVPNAGMRTWCPLRPAR